MTSSSGSTTTTGTSTTTETSTTSGEDTSTSTTGDPACLSWELVEGGREDDYVNEVVNLDGGGFAMAGWTKSKGAGADDAWLLKVSDEGEVVADLAFGSELQELANGLAVAPDQSMLLAGVTVDNDSDHDGLMIGVSAKGDKLWDLQLGDSNSDLLMAAIPVSSGGFAVAGVRDAGEGDGTFWLVRVDADGGLLWSETYGGAGQRFANDLVETADGGFAIAGSVGADVGLGDFWLLKTDADGQALWDRTYGTSKQERCTGIDLFDDGGFVIGGASADETTSTVLVVRTNADGDVMWESAIKTDVVNSRETTDDVRVLSDGGVLVVGTTSAYQGLADLWFAKLDGAGNTLWDRTYGGDSWDAATSAREAANGDLVIAGWTHSKGAGKTDAWVLRTAPNGELLCPQP